MRKLFAVLLGLTVSISLATGLYAQGDKVIGKDSKVTFEYSLTVDGELVDSSEGKPPFQYTRGAGMIIAGLEKKLDGMHVGEEKEVVIPASEGYGEVNPEAFHKVPKSTFPADMALQPGMYVEMKSDEGQSYPALIYEVEGDQVTLNFNHPLAGKELHFKIKITNIE